MLEEAGIENVEVVTSDQYQGYEADIVLVDLVRTHAPGFLRGVSKEEADRKFNGRLVVATSRSRQSMLVVGNIFGMSNAGDLWNLFTYYERHSLAFYYDGLAMREISVILRNELIAESNGNPTGQRNRHTTTERGAPRGSRPSGSGGARQ